jgi:hypothetical protein
MAFSIVDPVCVEQKGRQEAERDKRGDIHGPQDIANLRLVHLTHQNREEIPGKPDQECADQEQQGDLENRFPTPPQERRKEEEVKKNAQEKTRQRNSIEQVHAHLRETPNFRKSIHELHEFHQLLRGIRVIRGCLVHLDS